MLFTFPSWLSDPLRKCRRRSGFHHCDRVADLDLLSPYLEVIGSHLVDVYGCVHTFYEIDAPCIDVASEERLLTIREKLAGLMRSIPEAIGQLQFIFTNNADYRQLIESHNSYRGAWPAADAARDERVEHLHREAFERRLIRSRTILVISCLPHQLENSKRGHRKLPDWWNQLFPSDRGEHRLRQHTLTESAFDQARQTLRTADTLIRDHLKTIDTSIHLLNGSEIASYLYQVFNQDLAVDCGIPVRYNYHKTPINDAWLCNDWEIQRGAIHIGEYFHGFVSMIAKPQETRPRAIEALTTELGFNDVRVTLSVRRLNRLQQMDLLRRQRNRSMSRMREPMHWIDFIRNPKKVEDIKTAEYNVEARSEIDESNVLLSDLRAGREFLAVTQLVVHFWAKSPEALSEKKQRILARFQDMEQARGVSEDVATYQIFRSSLPGSIEPLERWTKMCGRMVADLVPLQRGYVGRDAPVCLLRNSQKGLVSLNLFATGESAKAPIAFVCGATGQGKSYLVNQLLLQHLVEDATVIILDIGGSYRSIVSLLGGQYFAFDPKTPFCFNPLQLFRNAGSLKNLSAERGSAGRVRDPTPAERIRLCRAIEALVSLPTDPGGQLEERLISKIDRAIRSAFQRAILENQPFVTTTDLLRQLRNFHIQGDSDYELLAQRLTIFCEGGLYGHWTSGPTSLHVQSRVVCFDLQGISDDPRLSRALVPNLIQYIHDIVLADRSKKKIVILDEMWRFLINPRLADFIISAWKTFRKENAMVIGSTQSLRTDLAGNTVVESAIVQSTESWFLLPQGKREDIDAAVELLHLTEGQRAILETLEQKKYVHPDGTVERWRELLFLRASNSAGGDSGRIRIQSLPREHWIATTSPEEVRIRTELLERNGGDLVQTIEQLAVQYPGGV